MFSIKSTKANRQKALTLHSVIALLLFCEVLHSVPTMAQTKPGIFYAVTGKDLRDTSWIFGTYHLVGGSYLNDVSTVKHAFKKSEGLVVEIVMDSSKIQAAQSMGMLTNKTLSELLDKPFSDSLDAELKSAIGVGITQLNQLKPMNVTLTLSVLYLMKNNGDVLKKYTGLPLDASFVQEAKQSGKEINPLETIEEQMHLLFDRTSDEQQVEQLKLFLRNKNEMIKMGDELMRTWFDSDLNKMYALYDETLKLSGEEDYLVRERNNNWIKVLPALMAKQSQFIAVGALHLAGPDGLVNQFRKMGYTVTPVKL